MLVGQVGPHDVKIEHILPKYSEICWQVVVGGWARGLDFVQGLLTAQAHGGEFWRK